MPQAFKWDGQCVAISARLLGGCSSAFDTAWYWASFVDISMDDIDTQGGTLNYTLAHSGICAADF